MIPDRVALLGHLGVGPGWRCAEVGVFNGGFAESIWKRNPARLQLVDPWRHQPGWVDSANRSQAEFDAMYAEVRQKFRPPVEIFRGTSWQFFDGANQPLFDFAYIDGRHDFEYVLADLFLWYRAVRVGGWLALHDYDGVEHWPGVKRAVTAFCDMTGEQVALVTQEASWRTAAIQKRLTGRG